MSSVVTLSDEDAVEKFKTINEKSILYFTASWCPPCKMIKPIYESMAKNHPELSFGKVDIDDNAEAAAKYEVRNNPPLNIFKKTSDK
jgi:thiol-disulfide isomerase/thioredoxin